MVGHVTPEAQCGGPIAIVENDDVITIDPEKKGITLVSFYDFCCCWNSDGETFMHLTGFFVI